MRKALALTVAQECPPLSQGGESDTLRAPTAQEMRGITAPFTSLPLCARHALL